MNDPKKLANQSVTINGNNVPLDLKEFKPIPPQSFQDKINITPKETPAATKNPSTNNLTYTALSSNL